MDEPKKQPETLSRDEVAGLIKMMWTALLAPDWTKDDLIDLGKTVFAKVSLAKIDDKLYMRLLPQLVKIAESLGLKVREREDAVAESFKKHVSKLTADFEAALLELDEKNRKLKLDLDVLTTHDLKVTSNAKAANEENLKLQSERDLLRAQVDDLKKEVALLTPAKSGSDVPTEKENG
jgi:hypothetical protein